MKSHPDVSGVAAAQAAAGMVVGGATVAGGCGWRGAGGRDRVVIVVGAAGGTVTGGAVVVEAGSLDVVVGGMAGVVPRVVKETSPPRLQATAVMRTATGTHHRRDNDFTTLGSSQDHFGGTSPGPSMVPDDPDPKWSKPLRRR